MPTRTLDPAWNVDSKQLRRTWEKKDFLHVLSFVNAIGWIAERANHHPDVRIYGWNKLEITVTTHDAGGLTDKDYELAAAIDAL